MKGKKPAITGTMTRNMTGFCNTTHINAVIQANKTSTEVLLDDGNKLQLQAGEFNYTYINNEGAVCRVHISVTRKSQTLSQQVCKH